MYIYAYQLRNVCITFLIILRIRHVKQITQVYALMQLKIQF